MRYERKSAGNEGRCRVDRTRMGPHYFGAVIVGVVSPAIICVTRDNVRAAGPALLDPNLTVSTVIAGLSQPTTMASARRDRLSTMAI